jgi:hypothetical protein
MSDSAAPAERAPAPEVNPNDMRAMANSIPDEAFDFDDDDIPAEGTAAERQEHEQPAREDGEEPGDDEAARRAAEDEPDEEQEAEAEAEREERRERGEETEEERTAREDRELKAAKETPVGEEPKSVKIDGQDFPIEEIKRGFLRQQDYTRKTQEVAQERQQVHGYAQHLRAQESELAQVLDLATEITRANLPQPPDPAMIDTDVIGYNKRQAAYTQEIQKLEKLVQARTALAQQQGEQQRAASEQEQQSRAQSVQAALQNEARLMHEKIPELRTPEGRNTFFAEAAKHGAAYGLAPEDIAGVQDHRMFLVLRDAMKFRQLQSAKPAAVEQARAAPPIRPAVRQPGTRGPDSRRAAEERFHRNPTIKNAAATLPDSLFD